MKTVLAFVSLSFILDGESREFSLTTAKYDLFKPTTVSNHNNLRRHSEDDHPSTPVNIFLDKKPVHVKKGHGDLWNWDYWCQLQPLKGNCSKNREKFYYSTQTDKCLKFKYSGCGGNNNRFDTVIQCTRHCKGAAFMDVKNIDITSTCSIQPNAGSCMAIFQRYYYDVNSGDCKRFVYGGCGGNDNRFHTIYRCRKKCRDDNNKDK